MPANTYDQEHRPPTQPNPVEDLIAAGVTVNGSYLDAEGK